MFAQTLCVLLLFIPLGKDLNRNMFLSTLLCPVFKHLGSMPWVNSMLHHMIRIGKTFLWITLSSDGTSQSELQLYQHNGARVEMSLSSIYITFNAWIRIPNAWKIMEHCHYGSKAHMMPFSEYNQTSRIWILSLTSASKAIKIWILSFDESINPLNALVMILLAWVKLWKWHWYAHISFQHLQQAYGSSSPKFFLLEP